LARRRDDKAFGWSECATKHATDLARIVHEAERPRVSEAAELSA
jgi:hypothetical protein